jgi:hypothetical protein
MGSHKNRENRLTRTATRAEHEFSLLKSSTIRGGFCRAGMGNALPAVRGNGILIIA